MNTFNTRLNYHLIDALRGIAIINMVLFHFFYDFFAVYSGNSNWFYLPSNRIWQQFICFSFIIIAGITFHFSRHNVKRSLKLNLLGLAITLITYLFMPSQIIIFGILNCIGCCIFAISILDKWILSISPYCGAFASIIFFVFTRNIVDGALTIPFLTEISIPNIWYNYSILIPFGLPPHGFFSSDYFPLFPWIFLFLFGYFIFPIIKSYAMLTNLCTKKVPILSNIGTHSIWIYLMHQPLCMLVCELLFRCTELA